MSETIEARISTAMPVDRARSTFAQILPWIICSIAALFYSYEYYLRIEPSVMASDLMKSYDIDATLLGNLAAFYYYAYTPMQLPVGILIDRFGPRRLLALACLMCAGGSYLFAFSGVYSIAAMGRFLVGFGSAFAFVGVLKLATIWLPPNRFALVSGLASALGTVGGMVGDASLTELVHKFGWRVTTNLSAAVGILLAFIILFSIRDSKKTRSPRQSVAHQPARTFKITYSGILSIIKNPQIWLVGAFGCLIYLPTTAFAEMWGIPYLKTTYLFSDQQAAGANIALFLGFMIGAPICGFISDRIKRRCLPMLIGAIGSTLCMALFLYVPHLSVKSVYTLLFSLGLMYSSQVIVFALACELSPRNLSGTAIAVTNMLVMFGGLLFQPVLGKILDYGWSGEVLNGVRYYTAGDYQFALTILPLCMLISGVVTFFLRETHCENQVKAELSS